VKGECPRPLDDRVFGKRSGNMGSRFCRGKKYFGTAVNHSREGAWTAGLEKDEFFEDFALTPEGENDMREKG
jgi:hypothetical protein